MKEKSVHEFIIFLDPRLSNVLIMSTAEPQKYEKEICTPKDVVALTWFFLAKVAAFEELFTSGVIRIDDPDARIFNFIDACEGVYERFESSTSSALSPFPIPSSNSPHLTSPHFHLASLPP